MSSKEHAARLAQALERSGLVTPKNEHFDQDLVRILCRVQKGKDDKWIALVKTMLLATEAEKGHVHSWGLHICRHYFLTGEKNDLVYGWNISVSSKSMTDSLDYLIRAMKGVTPKPAALGKGKETMEIALNGTASRNVPNEKGKGAYTVGSKDGFRPPARR